MRENGADLGGRRSGQRRARMDTGIGCGASTGVGVSVGAMCAPDVAARGHRIRTAAETRCGVVESAKERAGPARVGVGVAAGLPLTRRRRRLWLWLLLVSGVRTAAAGSERRASPGLLLPAHVHLRVRVRPGLQLRLVRRAHAKEGGRPARRRRGCGRWVLLVVVLLLLLLLLSKPGRDNVLSLILVRVRVRIVIFELVRLWLWQRQPPLRDGRHDSDCASEVSLSVLRLAVRVCRGRRGARHGVEIGVRREGQILPGRRGGRP